ncbi:class I SAM-dependent DNA methyltransferase [Roseateles noduli]|uniref:class I SAM-dependent DNA methyltransferase n=1 Tax=Roseateles noduli TaxID=2052484 RepID=UPI003D65B0D5
MKDDASGAPAALARHFEALFTDSADPWGYRTRWYEQRKRAMVLACLPRERYARGFEPGCANGELSAALATRCDRLLSTDGSETAVAHAKERLASLVHVDVTRATMPADWPVGRFDLIVLSEIGYYLEEGGLDALIRRAAASLETGGTLLASHWRHQEGDYLRLGDEVHRRIDLLLRERHGMTRLLRHDEADFLVEVWSDDARSVAQREGLRP